MTYVRRTLFLLTLGVLAATLTGCATALRPLETDLVNADPALVDAARSVMVMVTMMEGEGQRQRRSRRRSATVKLSSVIIVGEDRALTAAHSVVGRRIDHAGPDDPTPRVLMGWRTMPARVLERGDPDDISGEWAILELEDLREGRSRTDDGVPIAGLAEPVVGERCVLMGFPAEYMGNAWHRGVPGLWYPTPDDSAWRPPMPLVFEGRVTGVATKSGHRIAIGTQGDDLGGLSGGGAFVLRDGRWHLIGPVAQDQQWPWKREIGVTPLPAQVRALVSSTEPAPKH